MIYIHQYTHSVELIYRGYDLERSVAVTSQSVLWQRRSKETLLHLKYIFMLR